MPTDVNEYANVMRAGLMNQQSGPPQPQQPPTLDSGYFYAPYVPMLSTPVVLDPDSFRPREGILTRYGRRLLEEGARFYERLSLGEAVQGQEQNNDYQFGSHLERAIRQRRAYEERQRAKVNWAKEGF